jgi:hypothetical protein
LNREYRGQNEKDIAAMNENQVRRDERFAAPESYPQFTGS